MKSWSVGAANLSERVEKGGIRARDPWNREMPKLESLFQSMTQFPGLRKVESLRNLNRERKGRGAVGEQVGTFSGDRIPNASYSPFCRATSMAPSVLSDMTLVEVKKRRRVGGSARVVLEGREE